MEIIDISKFYRFESIPNPLIIASDIVSFNSKNKNIEQYIQIDNCKYWFNVWSNNTKKYFLKFDDIITTYFKTKKSSNARSSENSNIKTLLNKKKIYLIVKTIKTSSNNFIFTILPINDFDNLSNTAINRLYLHRDGLFEIDPNFSSNTILSENPTINRRFYNLNDLVITQGVFDSELDTKTKDLTLETEDEILKLKGLTNKVLGDDPKFYSIPNYENIDYLPEIDPDPEYQDNNDKDSIWLQKYGIPRQDYEYNEAEIDNNLFNNPVKYYSELSKGIFPVFESLNDAENFLLSTFEGVLEPLKKKKLSLSRKNFFELTRKEQYTLLLPNSYILDIDNLEISDPSNFKKLINYNKFQTQNLKKGRFYLGKKGLKEEKSNLEQKQINKDLNLYTINNFDRNAFIPISNYFLLNQVSNVNIIKLGLGDFMNLWFSLDISKENAISKFPQKFLKDINIIKQKKIKSHLLFIPTYMNEEYKTKDFNYLSKFKQDTNFINIFKREKAKFNKFKFVYKLGKVMDIDDVNHLLPLDLKL